jgi:hypothetical protein
VGAISLDVPAPEAWAIYVMDRGYLDFERLHTLTQWGAFFVTAPSRSRLALHFAADQPMEFVRVLTGHYWEWPNQHGYTVRRTRPIATLPRPSLRSLPT